MTRSSQILTAPEMRTPAGDLRARPDFPSVRAPTVPRMERPAPGGQAERGYTISEAARITGHTRNQIEYLDRTGLISPTIRRPGGKRRYFSFFELVELRTLARLRGDGDERISLQKVRRVVEVLEQLRDRPLRTCTLIGDGGSVFWVDEGSLVDVLNRCQTVMTVIVNLHGVEHEVRREMDLAGLAAPEIRHLPAEAAA